MTEKSYLWTTGGAGDGSTTYTRSDWRVMTGVMTAGSGFEGVAPGYLNELENTVTGANSVSVNTGGAVVDGRPYQNDASEAVNIPSAVGGGNTRIDRIVLRADWTAQTVRITRIAGTDSATPTAPAITQTSETTYDIMLYQALVDTSGTVTLTDERVWARLAGGDLTRRFLVPCLGIENQTDVTYYDVLSALGAYMQDAKLAIGFGQFFIPDDFGDSMTAQAVVRCSAVGDIYARHYVRYGAAGEAYNNHEHFSGYTAVTLAGSNANEEILSISMTSAAIGDYVSLQLERNAAHASDTLNTASYCVGWLVSYEVNP